MSQEENKFEKFSRSIKPLHFFLGSLLMVLASDMVLECTYSVKNIWVEPIPYYHCQAKIIADSHVRKITAVSHNNLAGYNNLNVTSIDFLNQVVTLPPRNIEAFFPNIGFYNLGNSHTEAIHPNDINRLPLLKYYLCQQNPKVIKIPPNMFANNPNLVGIGINVNSQIQHIAYHVLDHLDKLAYLYISGPCINLGIANDRNAVVGSLFKLFQACPPDLDMLNEQLSQRNCDCGNRE